MLKRHLGLLVVMIGILIVSSGFIYDVLFAGIPYQDPPAALQQQYAFHAGAAQALYTVGILVAGLGLAIVIGRFLLRHIRPQT